ncbi:hypothetical protein M422DRAFT_782264 [Sphaerobolus stellatus SS14]|uniref:DUF6535 domain-containing protein n=1 Tax=Sphaerobolus stellatus (strain SS14) TaxID=990650 RepID=A0A0C9UNB6_SPHS4|nr:hypothetical protein M422DRAFT_782264 [Sphaerobolus stellatus SS14]
MHDKDVLAQDSRNIDWSHDISVTPPESTFDREMWGQGRQHLGRSTVYPLNAATEMFSSRRRKYHLQNLDRDPVAEDPRSMSFPEFILSTRDAASPLGNRSTVSEKPDLNLGVAAALKGTRSKYSSQVTIQITEGDDEDSQMQVPLPRKQPSRFWGSESLAGELDIGEELGENAPIWDKYCEEARLHDKSMTEGWNADMDVLLVFAALFSAILTAFIIEFYKQLQPDTTTVLLNDMSSSLRCLASGVTCHNDVPVSLTFEIPVIFRWINTLWFTSLMLSLSVSSVAILVKQWVHAYYAGLKGLPNTYARIRQFRFAGIQKWKMSGVVSLLPSVMYLAVGLFFGGLILLLSTLDAIAYYVCLGISIASGLIYIITTLLPIIDPSCPFRTPAAQFLDRMVQGVSYYLSQSCHFFLYGFTTILEPVWNQFILSGNRQFDALAHRIWYIQTRSKQLLSKSFQAVLLHERERKAIDSKLSSINAEALVWLSNSPESQTQDLIVQSFAGLTCDVAFKELKKIPEGTIFAKRRRIIIG